MSADQVRVINSFVFVALMVGATCLELIGIAAIQFLTDDSPIYLDLSGASR